MAYPNDEEVGVGLAGPTANIGHELAHSAGAGGIASLFSKIQNAIGFKTAVQPLAPSWFPASPTTQVGSWTKTGRVVTFHMKASFSTSTPGTSCGFTTPSGWGLTGSSGTSFATGYKVRNGIAYPLMVTITSTDVRLLVWLNNSWVTESGPDDGFYQFSGTALAGNIT